VTNAAYAAWLSTAPSPIGQPPQCGFNLDYVPASAWPPGPAEACLPVVYVDWCDASAYCAAHGKRLCGKIGGGANGFTAAEINDVTLSQWYRVCSNALGTSFPYGMGNEPATCVGNGYDGTPGQQATDVRQRVGSATSCHGIGAPFDAVYDMSGNVFEWVDECDGTTGADDKCYRRGGAFETDGPALQCDDTSFSVREHATGTIGFRCCTG
jgi:formylglycine-generating enzyme required for sulfatase activity